MRTSILCKHLLFWSRKEEEYKWSVLNENNHSFHSLCNSYVYNLNVSVTAPVAAHMPHAFIKCTCIRCVCCMLDTSNIACIAEIYA